MFDQTNSVTEVNRFPKQSFLCFRLRALILLMFIHVTSMVCYGQQAESFFELKDEQIKKEISSFNLSGRDTTVSSALLKEIPLYNCTSGELYFSWKSTFIHVYASAFDSSKHSILLKDVSSSEVLIDNNLAWGVGDKMPNRQIDSVFFVAHAHFLVKFPAAAFRGLYEPHFCNVAQKAGKGDSINSVYNRVFQSADGRRIYIYMINGEGANRYEVTWIVENSKYYGRVVDSV
jgi:hypothetical protein